MDCDYYICKVLNIYFNDIDFLSIEIYKDKAYYQYNFNIDDKDYKKKINEYKIYILIPKIEPIILYENDKFLNSSFEKKYKIIVEIYLINNNKKWKDIKKIIIDEKRFERE
jgi:hypothetical protein